MRVIHPLTNLMFIALLLCLPSLLCAAGCEIMAAIARGERAPLKPSEMTIVTTSKWSGLTRKGKIAYGTVVKVLEPGNSGLRKDEEVLVYFPKSKSAKIYSNGFGDNTYKNIKLKPFIDPELKMMDERPLFVIEGKIPKSEEFKALVQGNKERDKAIVKVSTQKEFDQFKDLWKRNIVGEDSNEFLKNPNLVFTSVSSPDEVANPSLKKFCEFMKSETDSITIESDREGYVTVGKPTYRYVVVQTKEGELLGGNILITVEGGEYNGKKSHFDTKGAAIKDGVKDISNKWQVRGIFSHDKSVLEDPYLDWTDG